MRVHREFPVKALTACLILACCSTVGYNQPKPDTSSIRMKPSPTPKKDTPSTDTASKVKSYAARAALRSTIFPGAGQVYNRKYWKLPLVYGALAIPVGAFAYNLDWYRKCREAYSIRYHNDTSVVTPDLPINGIDQQLLPLSTQSLRLYRNEFRKNVDLSVLALLAVWGLNVVDAAVDGHLRSFDVSDQLSLRLEPMPTPTGLHMQVGIRWNIGAQGTVEAQGRR
ncbi:MAG: hypothetical protein EBZ67_05875 [Chitinophagia bacterium]|nr:hypothetical protein [Chitinophagia bacterium]